MFKSGSSILTRVIFLDTSEAHFRSTSVFESLASVHLFWGYVLVKSF